MCGFGESGKRWLVQLKPDPLDGVAMSQQVAYELRTATSRDEPWLDRLRREVYRDLFEATFGGWDEDRHRRHFTKCLAEGGISIIEVERESVGMIQVLEAPGSIRVGEIQIIRSHQNLGIGSQVLRDLVVRAHRAQKPVRLSVGLKNSRAYRLYRRLGFQDVEHSSTHYHLVCEPAV